MLENLDLNLLCYVDMILEESSVTRAAARLHISQSALSNALARARVLLNDDILVRSGKRMVPTPYAIRIKTPLRQAIESLKTDILPQKSFDPKTDSFCFRTAFRGFEESVILPGLFASLAEYPNLSLFNRHPRSIHDVDELAKGIIHFTLTPRIRERDGIMCKRLITEKFVCVVGQGFHANELDAGSLCNHKHLLISLFGGPGIVDQELEKHGMKRSIRITVGEFGTAPLMLLSDPSLVTIVPESLAKLWGRHYPLRVLSCPLKIEPLVLYLSWHASSQKSPPLVWFKDQIEKSLHICVDELCERFLYPCCC